MPRQDLARSRCAALTLAVLGSGGATAAPLEYTFDPAATRVHWEILHFGTSTIRGRFDAVEGSVTLDRQARIGQVSVSVTTASVSTGTPLFDALLRGPLLLDAKGQPQAFFVAQRLGFDGEQLASAAGEFTLRGVSQPLSLRALRFSCRTDSTPPREVCGGDFEGEIRRSDFGITHSLPFVADRVRLVVQVEAFR